MTTATPFVMAERCSEVLGADARGQHDFEVQKKGHQRIRNDADYDDWTYGTEPLPKEAWRVDGAGRAREAMQRE